MAVRTFSVPVVGKRSTHRHRGELVEAWVAGALSRARVEPIADPEGFFADVAEVRSAWGFGEIPEEALIDLEAGLEGWIRLKVADGDDDIPVMGGIRVPA